MARRFRFLHAADVHLDRPPSGPTQLAPEAVDWLVECPYRVFERIVDLAIAEEVNFVILAGGVVDLHRAGPRAVRFLTEQFQRLGERNIPVVWCAGEGDGGFELGRKAWPANVFLPGTGRVSSHDVLTAGERYVTVLHWPADCFSQDAAKHMPVLPTGAFVVAVSHHTRSMQEATVDWPLECAQLPGVGYWAWGGSHVQATTPRGSLTCHDPGTPLGRVPEEPGRHGVSIVEVSEQREIADLRFVPIDLLRYETVALLIDEQPSVEQLQSQAAQAIEARRASERTAWCITWRVTGPPLAMVKAHRAGVLERGLQAITERFGQEDPPVWSVGLVVDPWDDWPAAWCEDDSIRGELLRTFQACSAEETALAELQQDALSAAEAPAWAENSEDALRLTEDILREAAVLGVDWLSGEERLA